MRRQLPRLLAEALVTEVRLDLETALRAHPSVTASRNRLGKAHCFRLEQTLRAAFLAELAGAAPDPFFCHPVTDARGDRAARNVLLILEVAITAAVEAAASTQLPPLAAAIPPLAALVQSGLYPLGETCEGSLAGGYVVLVA